MREAEEFLLHLLLLFFCSWINHYVLIRAEYGSVGRALCKYCFFPLLLCIHPTCIRLQAPNLKEKLSQKISKHALIFEVKTSQCYQPMRVLYLKILITSNHLAPCSTKRCFQPDPRSIDCNQGLAQFWSPHR